MDAHALPAAAPTLTSRALGYLLARKKTVASWSFAVAVSVMVTLLRLGDTYAGFFADAAWTWAALGLVVTNIVATVIIILLLRALLQPQRFWLFIAVVAASIQVLVNSEYQTGLVGADSATQVEQLQTFSIGDYYNPLADRLNRAIDTKVRIVQNGHLRPLLAAYPEPEGATKLLGLFLEELEASISFPEDRKAGVAERLRAIVDDPMRRHEQKVRLIGLETYRVFSKAQVGEFVRRA